jgi:very-short-patch-repair endonuclease
MTVIALSQIRARHEREKLVLGMLKQLEYLSCAHWFCREYRFDPIRRWRFDLYSPTHRLALELHGGIWKGGRHTTGSGFAADREKMNAAVEAGIRVLEYTTAEVNSGNAALQVERIINATKEPSNART